ncbi:MAG: UmuC protein [Patescibacteria group bacterium]|nr:UmuC protein [Patescibacteria group bacterium]
MATLTKIPLKNEYNSAQPTVMHIDLNSCFAIIEQQANPLLRHKPVAIAAYDTPKGVIIASSYEAKAKGVKLGVNVQEARKLAPNICIRMPDPAKYRDAHKRFKTVLMAYTSNVTPKSIDEFVIDFSGSPSLRAGKNMQQIGYNIKKDIKKYLGSYVTVNVGIGTNRFLAKTAAGLNKPDGLDTITNQNIRSTFKNMCLQDITGINVAYTARLNAYGIFTPIQFLDTPAEKLVKNVFKSKVGYDWYLRLRGWEVDARNFATKSYGHQYALSKKTNNIKELSQILAKLCEKTGRRMRSNNYLAHGIHLWLRYSNYTAWAKGKSTINELYSTQDIIVQAQRLLNNAPLPCKVTNMGISVYKLQPSLPLQQSLFSGTRLDSHSIADATDIINNRYGEFTIVPGSMANMNDTILDRIAFGSIKNL